MHRSAWICVAALLGACDDRSAIELPKDAARPFQPAAALPAAPAQPRTPPPREAHEVPSSPEDANVHAVARARLRTKIRPELSRDDTLAHRVYEASFGPSAQTEEPTAVVLTTRPDPVLGTRLAGFALSDGQRFEFPPLHEEWASERVAAIMFRSVDDDADLEVIVLATYVEAADPEAPFFSNVVLDWDRQRQAFVRLPHIEGEIEAFSNATAVLTHLRSTAAAATP